MRPNPVGTERLGLKSQRYIGKLIVNFCPEVVKTNVVKDGLINVFIMEHKGCDIMIRYFS